MQKAAGNASHEHLAGAGDDRKARPERLARGGVGVDREIVEKQVGERVAGLVLGDAQLGGEDEPGRVDAARGSFAAQIGFGEIIGVEQPEHAAGHRAEEAHPDAEDAGGDLVDIVERAEHEAVRRQAAIGACPHGCRRAPLTVVGLIAVR